jgi:hypothetical protein
LSSELRRGRVIRVTAMGTIAVRSKPGKSFCRARVMRAVYRFFGECLASTSELIQL